MASEVDIGNIALSHLGQAANVSSFDPPEGSVYAENLAQFYPIVRDIVLQTFPWGEATRRNYLALLNTPDDESNPYARYVYAMPSDCLQPIALLVRGAADDCPEDFDIEADDDGNKIIICDVPRAIFKYTRVVKDTTKFSPLLIDAMGWLLASYMAGPVIKGDTGMAVGRQCLQVYQTQIANAQVAAMKGRRVDTGYGEHSPSWIAARG